MAPRVESTKVAEVITAPATDADIAAFQAQDAQRGVDLADFMQGTAVQRGGQHDMDPRGLTTDTGMFNQPPDFTGVQSLIPSQPTFVQDVPQQEVPPQHQDGQDYRKLYGQSENEKGELRRALQAQMDANSQLLSQVQQLINTPPPYPTSSTGYVDYNSGVTNGSYSYAPPTISQGQPQYSPPPQLPPRFTSKQDGEMVLAEDLEGTLRNVVAPAYYNLHQETVRAREEAAQLRQMLVTTEKARRGITPQLEAAALTQRPWVRNLSNNPQAYLDALGDFAESQRNLALIQRTAHPQLPPSPPPQAQLPGTAQSAARRITYIEGSNTPSQSFEPQSTQSQFEKEMAAAISEAHVGNRASIMRKVMAKYGITQANDWRDPSVSTR